MCISAVFHYSKLKDIQTKQYKKCIMAATIIKIIIINVKHVKRSQLKEHNFAKQKNTHEIKHYNNFSLRTAQY